MARKTFLPVALLLSAAACSDTPSAVPAGPEEEGLAPLYMAQAGRGVPGEYIVVLDDAADPEAVARAAGASLRREYRSAVRGFAARLTGPQVDALRRRADVAFIEQDQVAKKSVTQSIPLGGAWGLDRIDQTSRPLSGTFSYNHTGAGVTAYVVDSGIQWWHAEFMDSPSTTRVIGWLDWVGDGQNGWDCDGHGTHVAGTVGGTTFGVAKQVTLVAVRVLDCNGDGVNSNIIAAMDWIRQNGQRPGVVNMSLGSGYSKAMNQAVDRLSLARFPVVVAAGNESTYACDVSPASAVSAITVAASDSADYPASFTNWGRCVRLYAPGVDIPSAYLDNTYTYLSGTSMAAPHAAGVLALYLQKNPTNTAERARIWLNAQASRNKIRLNDSGGDRYGTPNSLLNKVGL